MYTQTYVYCMYIPEMLHHYICCTYNILHVRRELYSDTRNMFKIQRIYSNLPLTLITAPLKLRIAVTLDGRHSSIFNYHTKTLHPMCVCVCHHKLACL